MAVFYFDESIHERGGFILGAFVAANESMDARVADTLARHNLRPGRDEYKSSAYMALNPDLDALREDFRYMVAQCNLAVVVAPVDQRPRLGAVALQALHQFLGANDLSGLPHTIYFDNEIEPPSAQHSELLCLAGLHPSSTVYFGSDSRLIGGLQLADCAAHTGATVLLEEIGLISKDVAGRDVNGWSSDERFPLGFQLWATMRKAFFNGGLPPQPRGDDFFVDIHPYGLYIAPETPSAIAEPAMRRFGRAYLGCIR